MINFVFMFLSGLLVLLWMLSYSEFVNIIYKPASFEDLPQVKKKFLKSLMLLLVASLVIVIFNVLLKRPENPILLIALLPMGSLCIFSPIYVTMWIVFLGFNKGRKKHNS